ncbi:AlbA family DNA-binding domain-containing protein [Anabaena sp. WFMT]|uniref:AlbA family DNA-binding domain-containing protein n=1 Tax=Anabaena sp. WFMT TaxID=3449730 RepID=UPI003F23E5E7
MLPTGYLVIGADDKLKSDGKPTLRDVGNEVPTRREILEKVNSYCQPQLPDIQREEIWVDGIKLLIISIPPTPYLYRLSKQLKTPKKEYSPHTVLIRRGDGERTYEASPDEQRAMEEEKKTKFYQYSLGDTAKYFKQELDNTYAQIPQPIIETLKTLHWRINLYPQTYNAQLISSRNKCSELVQNTAVSIIPGGYSYPRKIGNSVIGSNWTGVWTDLFRHECWRLYQSGQFINFSGTWNNLNQIISDDEIFYTVTTVFRFAANLCQQEIYNGGINITIELNNVKNYGLKMESDLNDLPSQYRKATDNKYKNSWFMQSNSLSATSSDKQVFEAFNWFIECFSSEPLMSIEVFQEKQKKLLGG